MDISVASDAQVQAMMGVADKFAFAVVISDECVAEIERPAEILIL